MFWLKGCPRCAGDVATKEDIYGAEVMCLQCGHRLRRRDIETLAGATGRTPRTPQVVGIARPEQVQMAS
jgi:Zn ribbon nucleic-acid-binding protein